MQDDILRLAYEVSRVTEEKVGLIDDIMRKTKVLAMNARIEAARAGTNGAAFSVVAQEMTLVADDISRISDDLRRAIGSNTDRLEKAGSELLFEFRGTRFADLALNAIEIMDRNLYERSCDVRWWATDSAVVAALAEPSRGASDFASRRLETILRSYTVYLDLWVADRDGRVVATGRPSRYPDAIGADVSDTAWFQKAMATRSGDEFAVSDIDRYPLLRGAAAATYSTAVRRGGTSSGEALGALGIFFDWAPQAAAVVNGVARSVDDRAGSRVMLLDARYRVIAASDGIGLLDEIYPLRPTNTRGFYREGDRVIAYAETPGYETYAGLGWYGVIEAAAA